MHLLVCEHWTGLLETHIHVVDIEITPCGNLQLFWSNRTPICQLTPKLFVLELSNLKICHSLISLESNTASLGLIYKKKQLKIAMSYKRLYIMKFHFISLVFLLLTVHPVFSGHLFRLIFCRSLALTLLSVLAPSVKLHQRFGIPFLTICSYNTLSGTTWKHTISKQLLIPPSGKLQRLWLTCD